MNATTSQPVDAPAGVMDEAYARARATKPALRFRLRARAGVVVRAVREHLRPLAESQFEGDGTARFALAARSGTRLSSADHPEADCPSPAPALPSCAEEIHVLEVGAADGRTLVELRKRLGPGEYVGIEYDASLIACHPALPEGVRLTRGDAESLPDAVNEASFDVVSMLALLEHLGDPIAALREAHRVLRPGGLVVATCPNPFWDAIAGRIGLVDDGHHVDRIDVRQLESLVRRAGFEMVEASRFMFAPIASLPYLRVPVPPSVALAIDRVVGAVPGFRSLCVNAYVVGRRVN